MLLTVSTTHRPATDLGFLLHKNPSRVQTFEVFGGLAHVFYPEANEERCTVALLLEIDAIDLVRRRSAGGRAPAAGGVDQYVNDRPYAATSLLSVALGRVFASARSGRSTERPELATQAIPLEVTIAALPSDEGEDLIRRLFQPLGYAVQVTTEPLDERFPGWGLSRYHGVTLRATLPLARLLTDLTVLIPALDGEKHYWVGDDEVDKLLLRAGDWLGTHPERELITRRYLRGQRALTREALRRLSEEDDVDPDARVHRGDALEQGLERPLNLNRRRLQTVVEALRELGASRVADLGCGEGHLIELLLADARFTGILGMDVSVRALERATRNLHTDQMAPHQRERLTLVHGSLTYRDDRLRGWDAATAVEVIEHLDPDRLDAFSAAVFGHAQPPTVIVTTPNADCNALFPTLPAGHRRHPDHRFEWSRSAFQAWATAAGSRCGYAVTFRPIGDVDDRLGAPTQMAVFRR
ncbi:MAG: 3' terminal RNA ribose 2'-O-methyltransferase Hen1 [Candidatus Dormibacteria bacterium]|jgi:3' terminal RNA ribose 2'-O-methyltransferase Hen1